MVVSKVEVVVLGLLSEEPQHGYGLLERFRSRGMDNWVEVGKASVYQALRRLEQQGLVIGKPEKGAVGPARRVFTISRSGRDRLREGLRERFLEPTPSEAALAIAFAEMLPVAEARKAISERERMLRALLEKTAQGREIGARPVSGAVWSVMLDRQRTLAEAELAWLASYKLGRRG